MTGSGQDTATVAMTTASATRYGAWGAVNFLKSANATLNDASLNNRTATTLKNAYIQIRANAHTACTLSSINAGGAGNIAVAITATTPGVYSDVTHSDSIADGTTYPYKFVTGTGTGSISIAGLCAELDTASQSYVNLSSFGENVASHPTRYAPFAGSSTNAGGYGAATEALVQLSALESATLSNLQGRVSASGGSGSLSSRIGGVTGNQTFTIGAAGFYEDTTHTDSIVAGNLINTISLMDGSFGANTFAMGVKYLGATSNRAAVHSASPAHVAGSAAQNFWPFWGKTSLSTTEGDVQAPAIAGTFSGLKASVDVNSIGTNQNFSFRVGAATVNQVAVITASAAGVYSDSTHSDTVTAGQLFDATTASTFTSSASIIGFGVLFNGGPLTTPISIDYLMSVDFGQSLQRDNVGPIDWIATLLSNDLTSPVEELEALRADAAYPVEELEGLRGDISSPETSMGTIRADLPGPEEAGGSIVVSSGAPLEELEALRADISGPVEELTGLQADGRAPIEELAGLVASSAAPEETGLGLVATAQGPVEELTSLRRDLLSPVEFLAGLLRDDIAPVEIGGTLSSPIFADINSPIEWGSGVRADGLGAVEFLEGVRGDLIGPEASGGSLAADVGTPAEFGAGLRAEVALREEVLASLVATVTGPADTTASIRIDEAGLIAVLGSIRSDSGAPIDLGAGLVASGIGSLVDFQLTLVADSRTVAEFLSTVRSDSRAPVESLNRIYADLTALVDFFTAVPIRRLFFLMRGRIDGS